MYKGMLYTTCLLTSLTPLRLARKKKWNVQEEKRIQQVPITRSYFLPDLCMYICLSIKSPNSFLLFCLSFYLSLIYIAFISVLCSVCLRVCELCVCGVVCPIYSISIINSFAIQHCYVFLFFQEIEMQTYINRNKLQII